MRPSHDAAADYHTGRGGAGNEHHAHKPDEAGHGEAPVGLADRLKKKIFALFGKK